MFSSSKDKNQSIPKMKKAKAAPKRKLSRHRARNRRFRQAVDTNIVSIGFDVLEQDAQLAAGDATF